MPRNIKGKIVLVPFPFDDLSTIRNRPALCVSRVIGGHRQVILAYISSRLPDSPLPSDLIIQTSHLEFSATGLQVDSVVRLHHLTTLRIEMIGREMGDLPADLSAEVEKRLRRLFDLQS